MSKNMYAGACTQDGVELLPDARKALRRLSYFAVDGGIARVTGTGFRPDVEADVAGFWAAVEDHLGQHKPKGLGQHGAYMIGRDLDDRGIVDYPAHDYWEPEWRRIAVSKKPKTP